VEEANRFLRERYIPEIKRKFGVAAAEKGHAFPSEARPRPDLLGAGGAGSRQGQHRSASESGVAAARTVRRLATEPGERNPCQGLCHVRVPTWCPFRLQVYLNGHHWLAVQLRQRHIDSTLLDNAFTQIANHLPDKSSGQVSRLFRSTSEQGDR